MNYQLKRTFIHMGMEMPPLSSVDSSSFGAHYRVDLLANPDSMLTSVLIPYRLVNVEISNETPTGTSCLATVIWLTFLKKDIFLIENVQRRATKVVLQTKQNNKKKHKENSAMIMSFHVSMKQYIQNKISSF